MCHHTLPYFLFKSFLFLFLCMCLWLLYVCRFPWRPEECALLLELILQVVVSCPTWALEPGSGRWMNEDVLYFAGTSAKDSASELGDGGT